MRAHLATGQMPLFVERDRADTGLGRTSSNGTRLIHYLGSKLRLLRPICELMDELCGPDATVCDLFSGSGAVSSALARSSRVIAVDIQEYARVIAAGLFARPGALEAEDFIASALSRPSARRLSDAVAPLVELESHSMRDAESGAPEDLCLLLESGSLLTMSDHSLAVSSGTRRAASRVMKALEREALLGPPSLVSRYFGGLYFSWAQAAVLDALLAEAHARTGNDKDFLVAAVLVAASDIVNTVGKQFAQPIKPRQADGQVKLHLVQQVLRDRRMDVLTSVAVGMERLRAASPVRRGHRAYRSDYRDFLASGRPRVDAVYADPPYTRDHYSRYYHVLETMALYDEPSVSTTRIRTLGDTRMSRGLYRADRHQSPFSILRQAPEAFDALFRLVAARRVPLAVSYSLWNAKAGHRPRMLTLDQLDAIARRHFPHVEWRTIKGIRHNKFNLEHRNTETGDDVEQICVCRP
jgi:adenine-specific DNA-methyltransferase